MLHRFVVAIGIASLASGQALYRTEFHNDAGWSFPPPIQGSEWKVDALPAGVPNGPYRSPPFSLNYNDDTFHYDPHDAGTYVARSHVVDLSMATYDAVLVFWCNNQAVEAPWECGAHESFRVQVLQGTTKLLERCPTCESCPQSWGVEISPCVIDQWHKHTIVLDKSWGQVQVGFLMQGDQILNDGPGPFIDDLSILDLQLPSTYCTAKANSQGCDAEIQFEGVPEFASGGPFVLSAPDAINQQAGLLFYSLAGPDNTPFLGGTLCLRPPVIRTPVTSTGGDPPPPDCSGELAFDFNAWIASGNDPNLVPGVSVYAQFFYRDPVDPFKIGLTDGIRFVIHP